MKRTFVPMMVVIPMVILTIFVSSMSRGAEPVPPAPSTGTAFFDVRAAACPIMGGPPQAKVATLYQGKIYHFCCEGCIADFQRDPKTAIGKLTSVQEIPLVVTNPDRLCPITRKPVSENTFLVRGDFITFYCCPDCVGKDPLPEKKSGLAPTPDPILQADSGTPESACCR